MTGIYLIVVIALWFLLSLYIAGIIVRCTRLARTKPLMGVVIWVLLLILPVVDEIVGGVQFYSLCTSGSKISMDEKKISNKKVIYIGEDHEITEYPTAVKIRVFSIRYSDAITGETLASYKRYRAKGGWLIRMLGISEDNTPLLFKSGCAPEAAYNFLEKYRIGVIN